MKLATTVQMRNIDSAAIKEYGIPSAVLMENAGAAVARNTKALLGTISGRTVCVFAGKGNNGGDGFVAARHLANSGAKVKVFLACADKDLKDDALIYANAVRRMGIPIQEVNGNRDWDKVRIAVSFADCIVDALLGTGLQDAPQERIAKLIAIINASGKKVVAVDVPTGINSDTGQVVGAAVKADCTVTFGLSKQGLLFYPAKEYAGIIVQDDIGLPITLIDKMPINQWAVTHERVRAMLPCRKEDAYKGMQGHVGVVAGSRNYVGAAALCSTAALRCGAGLVTLAAGKELYPILQMKLTEVMLRELPDMADGALAFVAGAAALQELAKSNVLAIGPGLGRNPETMDAVRYMVNKADKPMILDADAIHAIAADKELLVKVKNDIIITPHLGEMSVLTGIPVQQIAQNRLEVARQTAIAIQAVLVLKGAPTVVALPSGDVYVNTVGNAGLATAGTGDVLTGIIASLRAQGLTAADAAVAGVYLHGFIADTIIGGGADSLLAGDLVNGLPTALARLRV